MKFLRFSCFLHKTRKKSKQMKVRMFSKIDKGGDINTMYLY